MTKMDEFPSNQPRRFTCYIDPEMLLYIVMYQGIRLSRQ